VLQVGGLQGKPPSRFFLIELVSMLYEVFRPGSTKSSIYRSIIVQVFSEVVGVVVCLVVFGGHSLNFVCVTGYVRIIMEQVVADIPGCIVNASEEFRLESLNYFYLVGLAHPHNWTPYDQMGLKTTLYRSNLFKDNLKLRSRS